MIERTLLPDIGRILEDWGKMVFLSGPRQMGKATVAKELQGRYGEGGAVRHDFSTEARFLANLQPADLPRRGADPGPPAHGRLPVGPVLGRFAPRANLGSPDLNSPARVQSSGRVSRPIPRGNLPG